MREGLGQTRLEELFPDWSDEVDRRIAASEIRIKFWIVGGALTNFIVAVGVAVPLIFYMGQISRDISQATQTQQAQTIELAATSKWMQDRMVWEAKVESVLQDKGLAVDTRTGRRLPESTP